MQGTFTNTSLDIQNLINSTLKSNGSSSIVLPNNNSFSNSLVKKSTETLEDFFTTLYLAPNIVEWASRPEFLNLLVEVEETGELKTIYDHQGQYQLIRDFFELLCPICAKSEDYNCWGKSRESLESQPLLIWDTVIKDDVCPQCNTTRQELQESGLLHDYDTLLAIIGMRAGKSITAAIIASFIEHKLLLLPNPSRYFGLTPNQTIGIAFVATTAKQSEKTVHEAWRGLRNNSPWIQNYIKKLKKLETFAGQYYEGKSGKRIKYNHTHINFEAFSSNSAGFAGSTGIASFVDELSRFDTTDSKKSGQEVFRVFERSLQTIRPLRLSKRIPNCFGLMVATTSPISVTDYAMRLGQLAPIMDNMLYVHKATWEFNPYQPRENFNDVYKQDPIGAERDFGANPPLAATPLIQDVEAFDRCINSNLKPTVEFKIVYPKDPMGIEYVGKDIQSSVIDSVNEKVIWGDAGKTKDSFTLVMAHGEWRDNTWITVYDFIMSIRPITNPKKIVHFQSAEDIIKNVTKKHKVKLVKFDRWNSEQLIQHLRFSHIDAGNYGLSVNEYIYFRDCINAGKVSMLPAKAEDLGKDPYTPEDFGGMSDAGRALHELKHLNRSPDFKKVDHSEGQANDIACGIVGANYLVQNMLNQQHQSSGTKKQNTSTMSLAKFRRW